MIKDLLKPRYKVISDFPNNPIPVGELQVCARSANIESWAKHLDKYPNIFKKLEWWEDRTLDELMSIQYVKITIYTGYWRVGDVVNVTDYKIDTKNKKLLLYILDGTQQSLPEKCEPTTLEQYKADKAKRSGRKVEI